MSDNSFNNTVESLFKGMDNFITTKTVIGDAVRFEDGTIVLPLVDVSFGVAAGAFSDDSAKKNNGGGGMGGKIQPSACDQRWNFPSCQCKESGWYYKIAGYGSGICGKIL